MVINKMKELVEKEIIKREIVPTVFTNMRSLLVPYVDDTPWPLCLSLPNIFFTAGTFMESSAVKGDSETLNQGHRTSERTVPICPHTDKKHYAKNMCNNCYHRFGRDKLAWSCPHKDRQHYAKGKCQLCYLQNYHRSKVFGKRRKRRNMKPKIETPMSIKA